MPQHYSHHPRTPSSQSFSLISAILANFRARSWLDDNFTSDGVITHGGESTEHSSSTKNNCTGTKDDDLGVAQQELDEASIPMQKEGGWISPRILY